MRKTIPLLFLFSLILISSFAFIPQVKADTAYEWIQNWDFEEGGYNALNNSGFEYGDTSYWGAAGTWVIDSTYQNTGEYCFRAALAVSWEAYQDFDAIAVTDLTEVSVWLMLPVGSSGSLFWKMRYNDTTWYIEDPYQGIQNDGEYHKYTFPIDELNQDKFVDTFYISDSGTSGTYVYVDDVRVEVDEPIGEGQKEINLLTEPWYAATNGFHGINTYFGYLSDCSGYLGYADAHNPICQDIPFLDSNLALNLSMYISTLSPTDLQFQVFLVYTDRSYSSATSDYIENADGWVFFDASDIILPNKIIMMVMIKVYGAETINYYSNIDKVSLYATVPYGTSVFSWTLSPTPISSTNSSFTAYQGIPHVFTGYLYNDTGDCEGEGTFSFVGSYSSGSGTISSGTFSFQLTARTSYQNISESIIINIVSDVRNFTLNIQAIWVNVGGGTMPPTGDGYDSWYSNMIVSFMLYFIFVFIPPLLFAWVLRERVNPIISFIAALALISGVGYASSLLPLWFLFLNILIIAFLFIFTFVRRF